MRILASAARLSVVAILALILGAAQLPSAPDWTTAFESIWEQSDGRWLITHRYIGKRPFDQIYLDPVTGEAGEVVLQDKQPVAVVGNNVIYESASISKPEYSDSQGNTIDFGFLLNSLDYSILDDAVLISAQDQQPVFKIAEFTSLPSGSAQVKVIETNLSALADPPRVYDYLGHNQADDEYWVSYGRRPPGLHVEDSDHIVPWTKVFGVFDADGKLVSEHDMGGFLPLHFDGSTFYGTVYDYDKRVPQLAKQEGIDGELELLDIAMPEDDKRVRTIVPIAGNRIWVFNSHYWVCFDLDNNEEVYRYNVHQAILDKLNEEIARDPDSVFRRLPDAK